MTRLFIAVGLALGLLTGGPVAHKGAPASGGAQQIHADGLCPLIYAPVICDHNKTYPNQCEADQHHAKNCVPLGI